MTVLVDDQVGCDKLQSHKSSFQAWKCVSFGCSLLAIVLLLSKWYEVNSDLQLLVGIERILTLQNNAESANKPLSWPPVPLDQLLPAANETDFGMASMESNGSMLMSHMHITLSREFTGNQLIEQEVSAFLGKLASQFELLVASRQHSLTRSLCLNRSRVQERQSYAEPELVAGLGLHRKLDTNEHGNQ